MGFPPMSHLRVKICGITNVEDARAAADAGADAVGLNFHKRSPRSVTIEVAREIIQAMPPFIEPVGVFAHPDDEKGEPFEDLHLRYYQWHGELENVPPFTPSARAWIRLIIAFRIHDQTSIDQMQRWLALAKDRGEQPFAVLIDGFKAGALGGTGKTAPWELLADWQPPVPLILAGGLTPENVAEAVKIVRPYAVDVASGVESSPGKKDVDKIKRFIENARSV